MRGLLIVIVLTAGAAHAVQPFSWTFDGSEFSVDVPQGMFWEVDYLSGFALTNGSEQPIVMDVTGENVGADVGGQRLLILPAVSFPEINVDGDIVTTLYSYNAPISASFSGTVQVGFAGPPNGVIPEFALNGYLTPILTGDFNGDSLVDAADYTVIRDDFGRFTSQPDYDAWAANFGAGGGGAAPIPEPAGWLLAAVAVALGGLRQSSVFGSS